VKCAITKHRGKEKERTEDFKDQETRSDFGWGIAFRGVALMLRT
jgi:hypothetical protein